MKEKIVAKYKESTQYGKGTLVIILINIVVFIALNTFPSLREELLLNQEISVILQRPWTLVTVFFSHELHIHILLNMALVFLFGLELEKNTNAKTVIIVYWLAGLMGSLSFPITRMFIERSGLIVGASAAAFGVAGAFGIFRPNAMILRGKSKIWVCALFGTSLLSLVLAPGTIDSGVAHIAGLIAGVICGYWLKVKGRKYLSNEQAMT